MHLCLKLVSANDQAALETGNKTMSSAFKVAAMAHRNGIHRILENPFTSICWQTPEARALGAREHVTFIAVDFCAFGTPWRKRTVLMFGHCDEADILSLSHRRCNGVGICDFTHKRHVQLTGSDPTGIPWTKRAEPYPTKLARRMAHMLLHREYTKRMT